HRICSTEYCIERFALLTSLKELVVCHIFRDPAIELTVQRYDKFTTFKPLRCSQPVLKCFMPSALCEPRYDEDSLNCDCTCQLQNGIRSKLAARLIANANVGKLWKDL